MSSRCARFFPLWKREPNFCGVGKNRIKAIEKYIEFSEEFAKKYDFDIDLVHVNMGQSSVMHLLPLAKDNPVRKRVMDKMAEELRSKRGISQRLVDSFIGLEPNKKPLKNPPPRTIIQSHSPIILEGMENGDLKSKISALTTALSDGQMSILYDIQKKYGLNDEYAAMCVGFIWIKERLDSNQGSD